MSVFPILLGLAVIAVGLIANKNPESWLFRRIDDDFERSDVQLSYTRYGGVVCSMMGVVISMFGMLF
ncbi:hypothetical protein MNQ98_04640 [Paenibacillus sp. N3/727]|uniref:hypothetical protein n=1 Tax=Paenibacillus sp. N3/727 TaxID=2925845 RepID=UPI001F5360B1|nr:hypothetical protein [Paenibacillus sp. N3/727]UNK19327.1 hypothetical protein MNQ98_04640 [Paenibacillus sp. N3/727]